MRDHTVEDYLNALSDRVPAPGGGAVGALHAAQAAALVAMVARYSDTAADRPVIDDIREAADASRLEAVRLAEQDMTAFTAVIDAYKLPKTTETETAARKTAIGDALVGAAQVPACVIEVAAHCMYLTERLLPVGNRNVISDIAAAAESARAAAATARVNIEINLGGIREPRQREKFTEAVGSVDDIALRAEKVGATVREQVTA